MLSLISISWGGGACYNTIRLPLDRKHFMAVAANINSSFSYNVILSIPFYCQFYHKTKGIATMIGKIIRDLRIEKGLSCSKLAKLSGHPVSSIHGLETGAIKNPRFKIVCDLSEILKISLDELKKYQE